MAKRRRPGLDTANRKTSRSTPQASVALQKPSRRVPGPVGRSAWFAERAGGHEYSLSIERLRAATEMADNMVAPSAVRDATLHEARTLFGGLGPAQRERVLKTPTLFDPAGRASTVQLQGKTADPFKTGFSPALRVGGPGILFIPLRAQSSPHLDISDVIVAEVTDPRHVRLNHTFSYWPEEDLLVGRVRHAGIYEIHGWPRDPLVRTAFETVAGYWPHLSRKRTPEVEAIVDRLAGLLPGLARARLATMVNGGTMPPFVKDRWDGVFEIPKAWQSIGPVPAEGFIGIGRVTQIDIHPTDGDILIAGTAGGGVWRTNNGGLSWWPTMQLEPTLTIGAVAIAPSNPNIMYAASGEDAGTSNPAWSGVGLYRTVNGGHTWTHMTPLPSTRFSAIAVHPLRPDTVYVAGNRGLHKSVDGGVTWRTNPGQQSLFDGPITDVVVAVDPPTLTGDVGLATGAMALALPTLLQERVYIGVNGRGVFRSLTGGEQSGPETAFTWLNGPNQPPSFVEAGWVKLAIGRRGAHGSQFLVAKMCDKGARIFTTTDGGTTWTERAQNVAADGRERWCSLIAVDPTDEKILYAGATTSLMRTTNGGAAKADWTPIHHGVHPDQQDMVFDPRDSRRVYLANDGGVYVSTDRGTTWTFASGSLAITQLYDIDISEKGRHIVAGGAQDNGCYYRNDFGVWRNIAVGDGTQTVIDPTDPSVFYFSPQQGFPYGLMRSLNGGATHEPLGTEGIIEHYPNTPFLSWITIMALEPREIDNPVTNRVVFVAAPHELFRSADAGKTWRIVADPDGARFTTVGTITAIEFAPSDPSVLYVGTTSALYRGINGGRSRADWSRLDVSGSTADAVLPNAQIFAIRVNPHDPNDVWVVFGGYGVSFVSRPEMILNPLGISHVFRNRNVLDDTGWYDASGASSGLSLPDIPTCAAALDDMDPEVAYVGTDVGVFRTADGGDTWGTFQDGLPRSPVVELRFNRRFRRLFAGTMGRGVFVRDL